MDFLMDVAQEEGGIEALRIASQFERPDDAFIPAGAEFIWDAFWCLHPERVQSVTGLSIPMGGTMIHSVPGQIGFGSIDRYASRYQIGGDSFHLLLHGVEQLDRAYLEWWDKEQKRRADNNGN